MYRKAYFYRRLDFLFHFYILFQICFYNVLSFFRSSRHRARSFISFPRWICSFQSTRFNCSNGIQCRAQSEQLLETRYSVSFFSKGVLSGVVNFVYDDPGRDIDFIAAVPNGNDALYISNPRTDFSTINHRSISSISLCFAYRDRYRATKIHYVTCCTRVSFFHPIRYRRIRAYLSITYLMYD